jgi:hypothetical protein
MSQEWEYKALAADLAALPEDYQHEHGAGRELSCSDVVDALDAIAQVFYRHGCPASTLSTGVRNFAEKFEQSAEWKRRRLAEVNPDPES